MTFPPRKRSAGAQGADRFAELAAAARRRMYVVAAAIVSDRAEAEDVVQDATITAMAKYQAGEFAAGSNFEAWICQVTRYTALNALRSRNRAAVHAGRDSLLAVRSSAAETGTAQRASSGPWAHDAERLGDALADLGETARLCLLLRIVGGLPYSAIAHVAEIPEGTAMSHVHRAQRTVRAALLRAAEHHQPAGEAP